ncbi:MAG: hypothetical protein WA364_14555 [Candidatus Nitrosopolaris sp.]
MNHRTTVVVALIAATGLSTMVYALPEQRALAWGGGGWGGGGCGFGGCGFQYPHHSINILSHSNQANNCSGNMAFCLNKLTNINCVHSICIIGDLAPWKLATPLPTSGSAQTTAAPNTNTPTANTAAANTAG